MSEQTAGQERPESRRPLSDVDREAMARGAEMLTEGIEEVVPDGWQGTPPAEGTRRKLILDALEDLSIRLISGNGGKPTSGSCLEAADAIEEALLRVVDNGATPESGSPASVAMDTLDDLGVPRTRDGAILTISDRVTVAADELVEARRQVGTDVDRLNAIAEERWQRIGELEEQLAVKEKTIEGFASTINEQANQLAGLRGRDDAWVASLAHRIAGAVVAGEPSGIACRRLLAEVGIPSLCHRHAEEELAKGARGAELRQNPHLPPDVANEARLGLIELEVEKALNHLILARRETVDPAELARINEAITAAHMVVEPPSFTATAEAVRKEVGEEPPADDSPGGDDPAATIKFLEGEVERLLGGREEARTLEGRFAEERDCAFALLRWLLPVTVAKRID